MTILFIDYQTFRMLRAPPRRITLDQTQNKTMYIRYNEWYKANSEIYKEDF